MSDELLAAAGRAGWVAYNEALPTEQEDEALARAVLDKLGIEWTGEWEWGVIQDSWSGPTYFPNYAAMRRFLNNTAPTQNLRAVRRPKISVRWGDVEVGE